MSELVKRKRSDHSSTDKEISPQTVQLAKDHVANLPTMENQTSGYATCSPPAQLYPLPSSHPPTFPINQRMTFPGSYQMSPGIPQQAILSDIDIQRVALAIKGLLMPEFQNMIEPLQSQISALQKENEHLRQEIDNLEMYSRRSCVRVAGVPESQQDTDAAIVEIAGKLNITLSREDIDVSHRVGPKSEERPRQIIARINNYELRHRLLKSSKNLRKVNGMERVSINQDLTKTRCKLAYEARQLVKLKNAKSTFVWDGKIFVIDHNDHKHKILSVADMNELFARIGY
jgi:hypothetical protein